jgi:hypothetical protein
MAFSTLTDLQEAANRIVKVAADISGTQFVPHLQDYLRIIIEQYQKDKTSTFIYSLEFTVRNYGHIPELTPIFIEALDIMIDQTRSVLSSKE